jgi:WD40 repeat protein
LDGVAAVAIVPLNNFCKERPQRPSIIIGTKRGIVLVARIDIDSDDASDAYSLPTFRSSTNDNLGLQLLGSATVSRYPVYCLDWSEEQVDGTSIIRIYAGCGDRYVYLLDATTEANAEKQVLRLSTERKLGPHTGWVKGLVAPTPSGIPSLLYSIGCNRIEGWVPNTWRPAGAFAIDSAVDGTCTLSSDLLCLTTIARSSHGPVVVAGGVDGRVHFFRPDLTGLVDDLWPSISAHQGRVNALCFEPTTGLLFSASSDATIGCWKVEDECKSISRLATLNVSYKVVCCSCWHDGSTVFLAAGTNVGSVEIFAASFDETHLQDLKLQKVHQMYIPGQPVINAVQPIRLDTRIVFAVGHSDGFHLCCELPLLHT